MARISHSERQRIWEDRLARYFDSNQTVASFCAQESVSIPSFYQWKRRLKPAMGSNSAAPIAPSDQNHIDPTTKLSSFAQLIVTTSDNEVTDSLDAAEATLPNGVSISLGCDPTIVATIVDRLVAYQQADCPETSGPVSNSGSQSC